MRLARADAFESAQSDKSASPGSAEKEIACCKCVEHAALPDPRDFAVATGADVETPALGAGHLSQCIQTKVV